MNNCSSVNDTDNDYSMRNKGSAIYRVCDDIMSTKTEVAEAGRTTYGIELDVAFLTTLDIFTIL